MAQFQRIRVLSETQALLDGIVDMDLHTIDGETYLYATSTAHWGVSTYRLLSGGGIEYVDTLTHSGAHGTRGLVQSSVVEIKGQPVLLPSGRYDDRMAIHRLNDDGEFHNYKYLGASTEYIGGISQTLVMQVGTKTYMVAAQYDQPGFQKFQIRNDLSLKHKGTITDDADVHLGDITAMASGVTAANGWTYFFMASGLDAGVTSYKMGLWGNTKERDSVDADDGLWVTAPTALDTVTIGAELFLIVASGGSSSLSVLRVDKWGVMRMQDHVIDDLATRFDDVTAIKAFSVNGRAFVVAGGSDDGLSLFELGANGKLMHLTTLADQWDTTLTNVAAFEVEVIGTSVRVFVTGTERGITEFTLDLGNIGQGIAGTNHNNSLTGTAQDDTIAGLAGADTIHGGGGDDIIIDGSGLDRMYGGAGADTFVFVVDRQVDMVLDFDPSEDRLDLSDFPLLYDTSRLTFTQKSYGVLIEYGSERFRLEAAGDTLQVADLTEDNFIF